MITIIKADEFENANVDKRRQWAAVCCERCQVEQRIWVIHFREMIESGEQLICRACQVYNKKTTEKLWKLLKAIHTKFYCTNVVQYWNKFDLVVGIWKMYPDVFGLKRYSHLYPDSNRIVVELVKATASGHLKQDVENYYTLTKKGFDHIREVPPDAMLYSRIVPTSSQRISDIGGDGTKRDESELRHIGPENSRREGEN